MSRCAQIHLRTESYQRLLYERVGAKNEETANEDSGVASHVTSRRKELAATLIGMSNAPDPVRMNVIQLDYFDPMQNEETANEDF